MSGVHLFNSSPTGAFLDKVLNPTHPQSLLTGGLYLADPVLTGLSNRQGRDPLTSVADPLAVFGSPQERQYNDPNFAQKQAQAQLAEFNQNYLAQQQANFTQEGSTASMLQSQANRQQAAVAQSTATILG